MSTGITITPQHPKNKEPSSEQVLSNSLVIFYLFFPPPESYHAHTPDVTLHGVLPGQVSADHECRLPLGCAAAT
jgi:hypothetical protein